MLIDKFNSKYYPENGFNNKLNEQIDQISMVWSSASSNFHTQGLILLRIIR